jgi:hypothetical protein
VFIPALQAILRRQVALAANGNGPAQRRHRKGPAIEPELALLAAAEAVEAKAKERPMPDRSSVNSSLPLPRAVGSGVTVRKTKLGATSLRVGFDMENSRFRKAAAI